eukprot:g32974.t1
MESRYLELSRELGKVTCRTSKGLRQTWLVFVSLAISVILRENWKRVVIIGIPLLIPEHSAHRQHKPYGVTSSVYIRDRAESLLSNPVESSSRVKTVIAGVDMQNITGCTYENIRYSTKMNNIESEHNPAASDVLLINKKQRTLTIQLRSRY